MALLGPIGQNETVNAPFVWGEGGRRLTPEEIALQRQRAEQQQLMGSDFSPVGSVWEGLGRVVQGYTGGLNERRADRAASANRAESQSVAELLMGQGEAAPGQNAVLEALVNPYLSNEVRQLAQTQYEQMNARAEASSPLGKIASDEGFIPGTPEFNNRVRELNEAEYRRLTPIEQGGAAITYNPLTGQAEYAVAPAGLANQLNEQPSIPQEAIDALRSGQGSPAQFDEVFGAGSAARVLGMSGPAPQLSESGVPTSMTPEQYRAVEQALGVAETADWASRNGIMVGQ